MKFTMHEIWQNNTGNWVQVGDVRYEVEDTKEFVHIGIFVHSVQPSQAAWIQNNPISLYCMCRNKQQMSGTTRDFLCSIWKISLSNDTNNSKATDWFCGGGRPEITGSIWCSDERWFSLSVQALASEAWNFDRSCNSVDTWKQDYRFRLTVSESSEHVYTKQI